MSYNYVKLKEAPILYKYKDAKNGLSIIENLKIKVTKPIDLNDAYELIPYPNIQNEMIKDAILYGPWKSDFISGINYKGNIINSDDDLYKFYNDNKERVDLYINKKRQEVIENISRTSKNMSKYTAIYSMSTDPNNHLMWSHYADGFKGICVGLDFKEYKGNSTLCSVLYSYDRPEITIERIIDDKLREEYIWEIMLTKSKCWEYENEYRMLFNIDNEEAKKEIILTDITPIIISEVYFTPKTDKTLIIKIKELLRKNIFSHVKLFHLKTNNDENKYNFITEESTIEEILEYNNHLEQTWR